MSRKYTAYDAAMEEAVDVYAALDTFCGDLLRHIDPDRRRNEYESPAGDIRIEDGRRTTRTIQYDGWSHTIGDHDSIKRAPNPIEALQSIIGVETALKTWWGSVVTDDPVPTTDFRGRVLGALNVMSDRLGQSANIGDVYHDILGDQSASALTMYLELDSPVTEVGETGSLLENGLDDPTYVDDELLLATPRRRRDYQGVAIRNVPSGTFSIHPVSSTRVDGKQEARDQIGYDKTYLEATDGRYPLKPDDPFSQSGNLNGGPRVLTAAGIVAQDVGRTGHRAVNGSNDTELVLSETAKVEFDKPVLVERGERPYTFTTDSEVTARFVFENQEQAIHIRPKRSVACWSLSGIF